MGGGGDIHVLEEDCQETYPMQQTAPVALQTPVAFPVPGLPMQTNTAIRIQGHPIIGIGEIFKARVF